MSYSRYLSTATTDATGIPATGVSTIRSHISWVSQSELNSLNTNSPAAQTAVSKPT